VPRKAVAAAAPGNPSTALSRSRFAATEWPRSACAQPVFEDIRCSVAGSTNAHHSSHAAAHVLSTCVAIVVSIPPPCSNTPCTQKAVAGASCSRVRDKGRGQAHAWEAAGGWSPGAFLPSLKSGTRRAPFVQDSTRLLLTTVTVPRLSSPIAAIKDRPARLLPLDPVVNDQVRLLENDHERFPRVCGLSGDGRFLRVGSE
jgi:hypothetical protein